MSLKRKIYFIVKSPLCLKVVNSAIKSLPKPILNFIPDKLIRLIPVVGKVPIELPDGNRFFLMADGNDPLTNFLFWRGFVGFEAETTPLFIRLAKRSNCIFDVGSHIGYYSLLAATVNQEGRVFAFEPVPRIYNQLTRNVELNQISNIIPVFSAVTNSDGVVKLFVPKGKLIPTSASTLKSSLKTKGGEEIEVPSITLDSFVRENNIPKVDLMKIDTERTEHFVLEGAKRVIERDEPVIICEVLKGRNEKVLQSFLDYLGFKYYWISKGLIQKNVIEGDETGQYRNYLFITQNKLKENVWIEEYII